MILSNSSNQLKEKCAVFGIYGSELEAARNTYYGLWALQHRGQESSGIVSSNGNKVFGHSGQGLVANVYREEDLIELQGSLAIGHNRYSTSGGLEDRHNQPFYNEKLNLAFAHNGNLPDVTKLEAFLASKKIDTIGMNDSAMMFAAIAFYKQKQGLSLAASIKKAWRLFTGVFSAVAMDEKNLVAFRDRCGVRPLSLAKLHNAYVVASETCAFDTIGAKFIRDIEPGELVIINENGLKSEIIEKSNLKLDIFELVYFSRPDSLLLGKRVNDVRKAFGRQMAKEYRIEADVVMPVPDSGIPAAIGYAQEAGLELDMGLIKNRYIHRTFIQPTSAMRKRALKMKLNPVEETVRDKRVILVDDSIVRGTTVRGVAELLYSVGAKEVHLAVTSPPVRYPDFYGINTPTPSELIAARMTVEEICEYIGASSLQYLSYEGMIKATGLPASSFCTSCFTGDYPIPIGDRIKEINYELPSKGPLKKTDLIARQYLESV